jgi:hypothetical protein
MTFSSALSRAVTSLQTRIDPVKKNNKASSHKFFLEAIAEAVRLKRFGPQVISLELPIDIGRTWANSYVLIDKVSMQLSPDIGPDN